MGPRGLVGCPGLRRRAPATRRALLWVGLLVGATACGSSSKSYLDPATNVVVSNEALTTTSSGCAVAGVVHNPTSTRRVDVSLQYKAFASDSVLIGLANVEIDGLDEGASSGFETSVFSDAPACSAISRFERSETTVWVD